MSYNSLSGQHWIQPEPLRAATLQCFLAFVISYSALSHIKCFRGTLAAERLQAYRERERRRYHQRKKLIADLPEETQRLRREAWRAAASRYRARKVSGVPQTDPTQPCTLSLNTETPEGTGGCVMGGPQGGSWSTTCGAHLQDSGTYCS